MQNTGRIGGHRFTCLAIHGYVVFKHGERRDAFGQDLLDEEPKGNFKSFKIAKQLKGCRQSV